MNYDNSTLLRLLWGIVESHAYFLRELSDDAIARWLLRTIQDRITIDTEEHRRLQVYISSRICLIRDIIDIRNPGISIPVSAEHLLPREATPSLESSAVA